MNAGEWTGKNGYQYRWAMDEDDEVVQVWSNNLTVWEYVRPPAEDLDLAIEARNAWRKERETMDFTNVLAELNKLDNVAQEALRLASLQKGRGVWDCSEAVDRLGTLARHIGKLRDIVAEGKAEREEAEPWVELTDFMRIRPDGSCPQYRRAGNGDWVGYWNNGELNARVLGYRKGREVALAESRARCCPHYLPNAELGNECEYAERYREQVSKYEVLEGQFNELATNVVKHHRGIEVFSKQGRDITGSRAWQRIVDLAKKKALQP